jgi:hypothetical protein
MTSWHTKGDRGAFDWLALAIYWLVLDEAKPLELDSRPLALD